ncbi:DUF799 domain-containing protein [Emcibacter sp.]|uniref:DUF799 domain-containing protein n=1 Tax=Emcibacter sp. TaxID=1979954 RepID=UPI002AA7FC08|nr:GNA1162 family protein [Emcibacter sp.]
MTKIKNFIMAAAALLMAACVSAPEYKDYSSFREADPHSILIVPVINHSEETEAADLFLTTVAVPLAERGYYVFPTNMIKGMMERDGLADPYLVHNADTTRLAELFGADSVVYIEILDWTSKYNVLSSGIKVHFLYTIKDGHSGKLLWQDEQVFLHNNSSSSGNILADLIATAVVAAVDNARSDYTPVAHSANAQALLLEGRGIPNGPYSKNYNKDLKQFPASGSGRISDATSIAVSYQTDPNEGMSGAENPDQNEVENSGSNEGNSDTETTTDQPVTEPTLP